MKQLLPSILLSAMIGLVPGSKAATAQILDSQLRAELDNPNIQVEYVPPRNSTWRPIYNRVMKRMALEQLKQFLAPLKLEHKLLLKTKECAANEPSGELNAWYSRGTVSITYCYQYLDLAERLAPTVPTPEGLTPEDAVDGVFVGTMFHELGHALIDLFNIPVFGREEDAADQIAGFVLLQFGREVARRTILAVSHKWKEASSSNPTNYLFDVHGTNLQRYYNFLCLGYGGFPDVFRDLVEKDQLPERRAANCGREYAQVKLAFEQTIKPHLDLRLAAIVQSIDWLPQKNPAVIVRTPQPST